MNGTLGECFIVRTLHRADLEQLLTLQRNVLLDLQNVDLFVPLSTLEFECMLQDQGMVIGCYLEGELIAFHSFFYPKESADNLGIDLDFDHKQLLQVAHLEATCVHPRHRGLGLQTKLTTILLNEMKTRGEYRYILQTVAPDNIASIKSTFKSGLSLVRYKHKYGGKKRFIFALDLVSPSVFDLSDRTTLKIDASMEQYETRFIQGYSGRELEVIDGELHIQFIKKLSLR